MKKRMKWHESQTTPLLGTPWLPSLRLSQNLKPVQPAPPGWRRTRGPISPHTTTPTWSGAKTERPGGLKGWGSFAVGQKPALQQPSKPGTSKKRRGGGGGGVAPPGVKWRPAGGRRPAFKWKVLVVGVPVLVHSFLENRKAVGVDGGPSRKVFVGVALKRLWEEFSIP